MIEYFESIHIFDRLESLALSRVSLSLSLMKCLDSSGLIPTYLGWHFSQSGMIWTFISFPFESFIFCSISFQVHVIFVPFMFTLLTFLLLVFLFFCVIYSYPLFWILGSVPSHWDNHLVILISNENLPWVFFTLNIITLRNKMDAHHLVIRA